MTAFNPNDMQTGWHHPPPPPYRPLSIAQGIRAAMSRNPEKVALSFAGQTLSYKRLVDRFDRVTAAILGDCGLPYGGRVGIVSRNCLEFLEIVIGASQAGMAVVTVNPRLNAAEIKTICDDSLPAVIFADPSSASLLADLKLDYAQRIITIGPGYEDWLDRARALPEPPLVDEWATYSIPYTSGTTGKPKGVMVPQRSRILNYFAMAAEYGCYSPDDRFLALTSLCFGAGQTYPLACMFFGGTVTLMDRFDPEVFLSTLRSEASTGIFMVPTHFHEIFQLAPEILERHRQRPHLRTIISNAAPLTETIKFRAIEYFGPGILHETYGSTEASIVTNLRPVDQLRKPRTVGHPFVATLIKIVRPDGEECAPGEVGELLSTSPYLFNGYLNKPKETALAFRNGWVGVGDLATRDEEGFIAIVGRNKDMVISGGVNIFPREIEEVLMDHPGVAEAAIIGVPDPKWGEKLRAFIVRQSGSDIAEKTLIEFAANRLSSFKVPGDIVFIDRLPRNPNGKIVKDRLRETTV